MTRYRKKPVEIEAVQFTGDNIEEIAEFMGIPLAGLQVSVDAVLRMDGNYGENTHIHIPTLEGTMTANCGDWIIKGVKGEFYPCKPDIFDETYEVIEDEGMTDLKSKPYPKSLLKLPEMTDAEKEAIRKNIEANDTTVLPLIEIHPVNNVIRDIGKVLEWLYIRGIGMHGMNEKIEELLRNITKEGEE